MEIAPLLSVRMQVFEGSRHVHGPAPSVGLMPARCTAETQAMRCVRLLFDSLLKRLPGKTKCAGVRFGYDAHTDAAYTAEAAAIT